MKNARPLLLAASTLALLISACSQPADIQAPMLEPQFGSADDDYGQDIALTSAQQVFVLSSRKGYSHDSSGEVNGFDERAILTRYDTSGKQIWSKELASYICEWDGYCDGNDIRSDVETLEADTKGYIYGVISWNGVADDEANVTHYYVYKVGSTGKLIKKIDVGTSGALIGDNYKANNHVDVAVDKDGAIYIAKRQFDFSSYYETLSYTNIVAKYSTSGSLQWQRTSKVGTPKAITVAPSGNVYVVGSTGISRYSSGGSLSWTKSGGGDDIAVSGSGLFVRKGATIRKYSSSGTQLWAKTQSGLSSPVIADMTGDTGGNLYLAGKVSTASSNRDAFVRKLSASGSVLWTKQYGTSSHDDARSVATLDGSTVYTAGATKGSLIEKNRGGSDGYVRKVDGSGNRVWTR